MASPKKPDAPLFSGEAGPLQRLIRDQRVLFLLVGGANTAFSTALFAALSWLLGPSVPSAVSLFIAWVVSLVLVFNVYRHLVFRVSGHVLRDFLRFVGVNTLSFLFNAGALTLLVEGAGLPAIPTQICITVVVVVFNYVGHKYFSFRRT
ncbi:MULTISPECIES: GtrA family protein [Stenotrophomonas maltophilia group]|uniref:GtrA family protein n=1 Tax=Stenotrophomonas maltophilia group TaxID=995085 RepID=UPI0013118766|nr:MULTISPECIES: GtrA family protein [Stenotrophomonas maltophilia group]